MKRIFFLITIILLSSTFCKKNPSDIEDQPTEQQLFLEDIYDEAISTYADTTLLIESFELFNSIIPKDTCGCFWDSYIYLADIYVKWDNLEKAREILLQAESLISDFPEEINHIKYKRKLAIRNKLQEIFPDSSFAISDSLFDSNPDTGRVVIYVPYDDPPRPIGGFAEIQKKIQYPQDALYQNIEGRVIVNAFVCWRGRVCKTRVVQGLKLESLNYEARRVLHEVKWKPALARNTIVEAWISVPIEFKIN